METNSLSGASMLYYLVHDLTTAPPTKKNKYLQKKNEDNA